LAEEWQPIKTNDTLMYKKIILLLCVLMLSGCAFLVAKETAKVIDKITEEEPNLTKKEKILKKQESKMKSNKQKAKEFYCSKVKDPIKCGDLK
jgi:outer membrane murein-binding lipoprotein Lpp